MAKLILTHEVSGLGAAGDVVDVKDGYARNYLLPRGLATAWTKGAQKQIDQIRRARKSRQISTVADAQAAAARLGDVKVVVQARAGDNGRLFGAVTTADIVEAVTAAGGPSLDRRTIEVPNPIKSLGEHKAAVKLHAEVVTPITVTVVPATR